MAKIKTPKQVALENIVRLNAEKSEVVQSILKTEQMYYSVKKRFEERIVELDAKLKVEIATLENIFSEHEKIIPIGFDFK